MDIGESAPIMVGLAGRARSGKDTVAEHLRARHGLQCLALADPIKNAVAAMLGVSRAVLDEYPKEMEIADLKASPRKLFQTLGTEWGRHMIDRDMWLTLADRQWRQACRNRDFIGLVISDVRMANEAAWVRSHGGVVVHLERATRERVRPHVSELPLPVLNGDFRLSNDGSIDELFRRVDDLVPLLKMTHAHRGTPNAVR